MTAELPWKLKTNAAQIFVTSVTKMLKYKKVYAEFFGLGPSDVSPCERCILNRELKRSITINQAVDIHHCEMKGMGGSDEKDVIENLGGVCRSCHDMLHSDPVENELFTQWCAELKARALVMRAFLFAEL